MHAEGKRLSAGLLEAFLFVPLGTRLQDFFLETDDIGEYSLDSPTTHSPHGNLILQKSNALYEKTQLVWVFTLCEWSSLYFVPQQSNLWLTRFKLL